MDESTPENIAAAINQFQRMPSEKYKQYCRRARETAEKYDFSELTKKLLTVIRGETFNEL